MRTLARSLRTLCTKSCPTPLQEALVRRIRFSGPLTVADYMRECLTHPTHGYYTTRPNVLGARGDFITAPEVSQVFGELLGLWAASVTQPASRFRLVELGPGTGKLMSDALRALAAVGRVPTRVDLVEASPILREKQKSVLKGAGVQVHWHDSVGEAINASGETPVVLVQEFLDALPVHVLDGTENGWRERLVDADDDGELRFVLAPGATPASAAGGDALVRWGAPPSSPGTVAELCLEGIGVTERIARAVAETGGAALFVDYATRHGGFVADWNSLRAFRRHEVVPVLTEPGRCDLTADVNFKHVAAAVEALDIPVNVHGPVSQRGLLLGLGAAHRFRQIGLSVVEDKGRSDEEKDEALATLQANYDRLTGKGEMGEMYQAVAITPDGTSVPDGFLHDATT